MKRYDVRGIQNKLRNVENVREFGNVSEKESDLTKKVRGVRGNRMNEGSEGKF